MPPTTDLAEVAHHPSHRILLGPLRPGEDRSVDAVVVPASRPAHNLRAAMTLSADLGAVFVALCSGRAAATDVGRLAASLGDLRWVAVDLPASWRPDLVHPLQQLRFRTSQDGFRQVASRSDLSTKRNVTLLVAQLAGWDRLLFLDDDIREVDAGTVRKAASALAPGGAVGIPATEFPDNSVVCHANGIVNPRQDVFVSGSALVVDTDGVDSFFPTVYNEDWLYLADALARGAVSAVGASVQLPYDPFADPERARAEEFGDVLAEGLVALMHSGRSFGGADARYWSAFLDKRTELVAQVRTALTNRGEPAGLRRLRVLRSLRAADRRRAEIRPELLADYVSAWRADRADWAAAVAGLPRGIGLAGALSMLLLAERAQLSERLRPSRRAGGGAVASGHPPYVRPHPDIDRVLAREQVNRDRFATLRTRPEADAALAALRESDRRAKLEALVAAERDCRDRFAVRAVGPAPVVQSAGLTDEQAGS